MPYHGLGLKTEFGDKDYVSPPYGNIWTESL